VERITLLDRITDLLRGRDDWHPIDALVLPGGFFRMSRALGPVGFTERRSRVSSEKFAQAACIAVRALDKLSPGFRMITGVLATPRDLTERTEQSSLAFGGSGLVAAARKIFPTAQDSKGKQFTSPFEGDYSSAHRFLHLANGSVAALNACYDLFGVADIGSDTGARRLAIRRLYTKGGSITRTDDGFIQTRQKCLTAWTELVRQKQPDVALATIHRFRQAGQDGFWQRHGIARASAALGGALVAGAAHFEVGLPRPTISTLASWRVPHAHLSQGLGRKAHRLDPKAFLVAEEEGIKILMRLFTPLHSTHGGRP
jgi:hypothetical protein